MQIEESKRKKIKRFTTGVSLLLLLGMAIFLVVSIQQEEVNQTLFYIIMIGSLFIFWLLMDVIEPRLLHELDDITFERRQAYYKYIGLDALGYAGLAYFVLSLGENGNGGLIGAVIYGLSVGGKRRFRDEFKGINQEEAEVVEEAVEEVKAAEEIEAIEEIEEKEED